MKNKARLGFKFQSFQGLRPRLDPWAGPPGWTPRLDPRIEALGWVLVYEDLQSWPPKPGSPRAESPHWTPWLDPQIRLGLGTPSPVWHPQSSDPLVMDPRLDFSICPQY